jgi:hypothetical protein
MRVLFVAVLVLAGCADGQSEIAGCAARGYGPDRASLSDCRREIYAERQQRLAEFRVVPMGFRQ